MFSIEIIILIPTQKNYIFDFIKDLVVYDISKISFLELNDYSDYYNKIVKIIVKTNKNPDFYENYLDSLIFGTKIRYNLVIYTPNKLYPKSVRINRKNKKIITKNQTKIFIFR